MDEQIRELLDEYGHLSGPAATLGQTDDLYRLGLTSHSSVNLMLALEDSFDVEFTDAMLRKSTFESIQSIREALVSLGADYAGATQ
jgi:acyl carrier protein